MNYKCKTISFMHKVKMSLISPQSEKIVSVSFRTLDIETGVHLRFVHSMI